MSRKGTIRMFKNANPHICFYCGKELKTKELTVDHIIPRSKGGKSVPNNMIISCEECNTLKADMDFAEFINTKCNNSQKLKQLRKNLLEIYKQNVSYYSMPHDKVVLLNNIHGKIVQILSHIASESFSKDKAFEYCLEISYLYNQKKSIREEIMQERTI